MSATASHTAGATSRVRLAWEVASGVPPLGEQRMKPDAPCSVEGHTVADPIYGVPLVALRGGAALLLLGHIGSGATCFVVVLLALIPVAAMLPALVTLAVLAVVLSALIGYETSRYAEQRRQVRGAADEHRGPAHGSSVSGASIQIAA